MHYDCLLTDFEGERGEVGEAERSLSLSIALSVLALAGGASPFDFAGTGVTGRAGVDGVEVAESDAAGADGVVPSPTAESSGAEGSDREKEKEKEKDKKKSRRRSLWKGLGFSK